MNIIITEEFKKRLLKLAKKKARCDKEDFMVDDYAGGNIDDAYSIGADDGEILMAREICDEIGLEY